MVSLFTGWRAAVARRANFGAVLQMADTAMPSFSVDVRVCRPTDPCQHKVVVDGREEWWGARRIVDALERRHQPVPDHFLYIKTQESPMQSLMALMRTNELK